MKLWLTHLRKANREINNFHNQMVNDAIKEVNSANWQWKYRPMRRLETFSWDLGENVK